MPAWIHDRAEHLRRKNPSMPEGQAWAIATQQAHAAGKSPKGYGTAEGRRTAKQKYDAPKSQYKKVADPSSKSKTSMSLALLKGFSDEMKKIASKRRDASKSFVNSRPVPGSLPPPLATDASGN